MKNPIYQDLSSDCLPSLDSKTLVCDIYGTLLSTQHSFFPYFVLVAFEARGSILRALLLLITYPLLWLLPLEIKLRIMIFITFCGLSLKDMNRIQRAVLPKFYLENLNSQFYHLMASASKRVILTSLPRVMVECFLKEYLEIDHVLGTELHHLGPYYTGLLTTSGLLVKHKALKQHFGEEKPDDVIRVRLASTSQIRNNPNSKIPENRPPKPVIFHDGRLAFLPTPTATLCFFMWLPLGAILVILRSILATFLPYKLALPICGFIGMRLITNTPKTLNPTTTMHTNSNVLYVSNHRTLLDPLYISSCVGKRLTTVTYSISRISETLSSVRTERLTRDRKQDKEKIYKLLNEDDLLIFPEGTTCREPYLLRFSPLFAEMTDEIVPVAIDTRVSVFYANTATGFKALDPLFFLMNPTPTYVVQILEKLPKEMTYGGGGKCSFDVANCIQRRIGEVLGFECTSLTRRDKYMLLAGHQGLVNR